MINKHKSDFI